MVIFVVKQQVVKAGGSRSCRFDEYIEPHLKMNYGERRFISEDFEVKNFQLEYSIPAKLGDTLVLVACHIGKTIIVMLDIHRKAVLL